MFDEPRNWKWMTPSGATVVLLVAWMQTAAWMGQWSLIWIGLAGVCAVAGIANLVLYVRHHGASATERILVARSVTPQVRIAEAFQKMHPEAQAYYAHHQRIVWRYKYLPTVDLVDYVLDEIPSVHMSFVAFLLENSTSRSLMPISMASEGAYMFDPSKTVTDRQQYNDFVLWLQAHMMATQAFGNQSAAWFPPYGPEMLRHRFGLDVEEGTGELGKVAERAEAWKAEKIESQKSKVEGRKADDSIPELTEEEVRAHEAVRYQYDAMHGNK
jgi:hypothetical protein